ncbi:MAG: hypothetical protein GY854_22335 [Deltaproteobacteria bacterium]|nr:hypothetical protein [Deltaproteobacteria bacterium]
MMTLKVAVLVKQVPDHEAIVQIGADGNLDIENRYVCSFFDEIAIEQALVLAKAHQGTELVALSVGGKRAVEALRRAVAMGIDRVEQIGDDSLDSADSVYVAALLAARLRDFAPHLVLTGKQACDNDLGAVGPMVAEFIGCPHVSAVASMSLNMDSQAVEVARKVEGGTWTLKTGLPLVASVDKGLVEPHLPVVTRVMKAMKAKITAVDASTLDVGGLAPGGRLERLGYAAPPARPPVTMLEDVTALARSIKQSGAVG